MPYKTNEIVVGLAIHFDAPERLRWEEVVVKVSCNTPAMGPHYFLCVKIERANGLWVPMFTENKPGKLVVGEKTGPAGSKWLTRDSHFYTNQSWKIPLDIAALYSDGDTATTPNMASSNGVQSVLAKLNRYSRDFLQDQDAR